MENEWNQWKSTYELSINISGRELMSGMFSCRVCRFDFNHITPSWYVLYVWMDVEEWWTNIQKSPEQVGAFLTQISFSVFVLNFVLIITKCYCFHTIPLSLFGLLFPISHFVATVFYFFYYQAVFKLSSLHLPLLHFHTLSIFVILPSLPSFISLCLSAFEDRLADRCV